MSNREPDDPLDLIPSADLRALVSRYGDAREAFGHRLGAWPTMPEATRLEALNRVLLAERRLADAIAALMKSGSAR